jgi:putative peptidoglycan lipid II flippase
MRASYARQDTRTPWIVNGLAVAFNIAISIPLFLWLEVPGLGLGHAASYTFAALLGVAVLRRQLGGIDGARVVASATRITVAAAASAAGAWLVSRALAPGGVEPALGPQLLQVGAAIATGIAIYAGLAVAFRMEEFRPLLRMVTGRFSRGEAPA